jgi:hypothetical protein
VTILADQTFSAAAENFQETFEHFQTDIEKISESYTYLDLFNELEKNVAEYYPLYNSIVSTLSHSLEELKENMSEEDSFMMNIFMEDSSVIHGLIKNYLLLISNNLIDKSEKIRILKKLEQCFNKIENYFKYVENLERSIYFAYVSKIKSVLLVLPFLKKETTFNKEIRAIKEQVKSEYNKITQQRELFTKYIMAIKRLKSECAALLDTPKTPIAQHLLKGITQQPEKGYNEQLNNGSYIPFISSRP